MAGPARSDERARSAPGGSARGGKKGTIQITPAESRARQLPPAGLAITPGWGGWSASRFPEQGCYLRLSGPPGGPLLFEVWHFPLGKASGATLSNWLRSRFNRPFHRPRAFGKPTTFKLAGASRPAVSVTVGRGLAKTAWCAVLVATRTQPRLELVIAFGHGSGTQNLSCAQIAKHRALQPVLSSFRLVP